MPPVDRKNPVRAKSSESSFSLMEFMREFSDDDACLEWLWRNRYAPDGEHAFCERCARVRSFRRYRTKYQAQAWTCTSCTKKLYPTAGTVFHKSSTSLHLWFYAMWLITSTRCGISAKQLERELGVTYKTAWRMFNLIRNRLMVQDYQGPLSGQVEVDETFVGGKPRAGARRRAQALGLHPSAHIPPKTVVLGMVQRGGKVRANVVPTSRGWHVRPLVREFVLPGSLIFTDEWYAYNRLGKERYVHKRIRHKERVYVEGETHTQTIEGFFSLVKNGIRGVYHSVSAKWLQGYVNEYAWRYNHRDEPGAMFLRLLQRAATSS